MKPEQSAFVQGLMNLSYENVYVFPLVVPPAEANTF